MKSAPENDIPFESALEKLEELVTKLETGELPLGSAIDHFQEGHDLLSICTRRLRDAELKIEALKKEHNAISFENFDPDKS